MTEQKIRRKTFVGTLGAIFLGAIGLKASPSPRIQESEAANPNADNRVKPAPKSVSYGSKAN
jgi:hypothetical protein